MNFCFPAWVVYVNGNPYSWHLSRAAAYKDRGQLEDNHPHGRWAVGKSDAQIVLRPTAASEEVKAGCGSPSSGA